MCVISLTTARVMSVSGTSRTTTTSRHESIALQPGLPTRALTRLCTGMKTMTSTTAHSRTSMKGCNIAQHR
jgi:hypothetical protein